MSAARKVISTTIAEGEAKAWAAGYDRAIREIRQKAMRVRDQAGALEFLDWCRYILGQEPWKEQK